MDVLVGRIVADRERGADQRVEHQRVRRVVDERRRQRQFQHVAAEVQCAARALAERVDAGHGAESDAAEAGQLEAQPLVAGRGERQRRGDTAAHDEIAGARGLLCKHETLFDAVGSCFIPFDHGAARIVHFLVGDPRVDRRGIRHRLRAAHAVDERELQARVDGDPLAEQGREHRPLRVEAGAVARTTGVDRVLGSSDAVGRADRLGGLGGETGSQDDSQQSGTQEQHGVLGAKQCGGPRGCRRRQRPGS